MDLLKGKVCVEKFEIVAVTETWIDTTSKNFLSEFEKAGYQRIHKDRVGRRGRVALFVKDTLNCFVNISITTNDNSESVVVMSQREEKN